MEPQLVDDGRHVIGPELAVGVVLALERGLGHPVAAQIAGDEPELAGELAFVLPGPAQVVLRPAVHEQDRRPVRPAPLAHVQPQAAAAPHYVNLHPPLLVLRDRCHFPPPWFLVPARSWPSGKRERIGRRALSPTLALRIFGGLDAYELPSCHGVSCAILPE